MKPIMKVKANFKRTGIEVETHNYEYDLVNKEGKRFHVTVRRELTKQTPILKN